MNMLVGFLVGLGPILLGFGLALYFVPSVIAFGRGHRQRWPVFVANLFLGGTGIGWVGCLIWSIWAGQGTSRSMARVVGTVGSALFAVAIASVFLGFLIAQSVQTEVLTVESKTTVDRVREAQQAKEMYERLSAPKPISPEQAKPTYDSQSLERLIEGTTGK